MGNMWTIKLNKCLSCLTVWLLVFFQTLANAAGENPQAFTYEGRLYDSSGNPLTENVTFQLSIFNSALDCLLYQEEQSINLASTDGIFSLSVGSATGAGKRTGDDPGLTIPTIFQNATAINPGVSANCASGGFTPSTTEARILKVVVTPSSTGTPETLTPNQTLNSVPSAIVAETLQGSTPADFLQVSSGDNLSQSNLESIFTGTNFTTLTALINGTSTDYVQSGSSVDLGSGTAFTTGQLGVGTSSPASGVQIEVQDTSPTIRLEATASGGGTSELEFHSGASTLNSRIYNDEGSQNLRFATGSTDALVIDSNQDATFTSDIVAGDTLRPGKKSDAQETTLFGTFTPGTEDGAIWFNDTNDNLKFFNGAGTEATGVEAICSIPEGSLSNGAVVYTTATDYAVSNVGTSGQALLSVGGGAPQFGALDLSDTNVTSANALPISRGGTGSTTQNFVDLTTTQTVAGAKTWSNNAVFSGTATVTGDLTVDTNTLFVDSANSRVGVGTTSPATTFDVNSSDSSTMTVQATTGNSVLTALTVEQEDTDSAGSNNIGVDIDFSIETATDTTNEVAGTIEVLATDATAAAVDSTMNFYTMVNSVKTESLSVVGTQIHVNTICDESGANCADISAGLSTGGGDFAGPGSATDNAIVRFDGTGGKTGQNSGVTIDDSNNMTGIVNLTATGDVTFDTNTFVVDSANNQIEVTQICDESGSNCFDMNAGGSGAWGIGSSYWGSSGDELTVSGGTGNSTFVISADSNNDDSDAPLLAFHTNSATTGSVGIVGPTSLYTDAQANATFVRSNDNDIQFVTGSTAAARVTIHDTGEVSIGNTSTAHNLNVTGTAGLSTGTAWTNTSDRRLKDIHGDYEYGLKEVLALNTVRFNYKKDNELGLPSDHEIIGFVAQEVQEVIPDAVFEREDVYLELNVDPIHWAVVNAVQELNNKCEASQEQLNKMAALANKVAQNSRSIASVDSRVDALEKENQKLKAENKVLQERLEKIEAALGL